LGGKSSVPAAHGLVLQKLQKPATLGVWRGAGFLGETSPRNLTSQFFSLVAQSVKVVARLWFVCGIAVRSIFKYALKEC
jgi:hypothetical protein